MNKRSAFLIAAPKSNSGKTVITLGLIRALTEKGLQVQPFKTGPDYIDPMHHRMVAGRASYNLDLWMSSEKHVRNLFYTHFDRADVSVVEGVMGLFDGARKDEGSSAALARKLNLPVVLVVDAKSMAYSAAPLLFGFKNFDERLNVCGVIFNRVGSASHYEFLKEAANDAGLEALGYVLRDDRMQMESRHLGLVLPDELPEDHPVTVAAEQLKAHVDLEQLLQLTVMDDNENRRRPSLRTDYLAEMLEVNKPKSDPEATTELNEQPKALKIAFARDQAFNFSYQANVDALSKLGEVRFFSPLHDTQLPAADLVWLPGGYPELFARELAENTAMKEQLLAHVKAGKMLVAECGGMMYLGKNLITKDGKTWPMTGLFDLDTSFEQMKLHLGYRRIIAGKNEWMGHEFHYSNLINREPSRVDVDVLTARGRKVDMPIFIKQRCIGSYFHVYLGDPEQMKLFLKRLQQYNESNE